MVPGGGVMPQFLQASFDMLRDSQSKMMENMNAMNPMAQIPGFEAMKAQQEAFLKAMTGGFGGGWTGGGEEGSGAEGEEDLDAIKRQLAELQEKLSKLS
jgi:polyhydroxyalkanoate synthesis regulator protein